MYRVIYKDLPCTVGGFLTMDPDGFYTIVLNSRLSSEQNKKTYNHELLHILHDDLYSDKTAQEIENLRHNKSDPALPGSPLP